MKYYVLLMICLVSTFTATGQRKVLDKVVAKVGNEYVLLSEIEERISLASEKGPLPEGARCTFLEELMIQNLLVHYARIDSLEVTDEQVEAQLDDRISNILEMMGEDVTRFESYYGMTIAQAKERFRIDLRKQMNAQMVQTNIVDGITVTPSEVIEYFESIPTDSLPYFNSEVEIGEIVYKPRVNEEEQNKALEKIKSIQQRLREGEDFEELAKLYSDDRGSAALGGALGRNPRGTFVREFEAAAYRLEVGEISDIVETEFGYHLIKLNARYGSVIDANHILVKPEMSRADLDSAEVFLYRLRDSIYNGKISFQEAVREFSDENTQSYSNSGRVVNPKTGNTFFETADLEPDIFFAVDTIDVGDLTVPISFRMPTGDVIYRLVQLQSRTPPHKASMQQDYSKIQNAAKQSKQNEAFNSWMDKKIAETYILIDPNFAQCPNLVPWHAANVKP